MTNFEKIKAMSVEEMARLLSEELNLVCDSCPAIDTCTTNDNGCRSNLHKWLQSENLKQCDRCKKYYEKNRIKHDGETIVGVAFAVDYEYHRFRGLKTLCDNCLNRLDEWLESEVEEND